jgi:hypothetical protein
MDRSGRGSRDESLGRKVKGSTGKGPKILRENKHTSTSSTNDDHFGIEAVIHGSGIDVGSTKYPSTMFRTTVRRSIEGDRRPDHCTRKGETSRT